jgi:rhodanese-related sulfurtransferase
MVILALAPDFLDGWLKDHPTAPGLIFAGVCLLVLLLAMVPRMLSWGRGKGRPMLDPVQVEELLTGSGALVLDLRSASAFQKGHIRGSLHVPFDQLATRFVAPDPTATRALILVDETDHRAHQAYDLLRSHGYSWMYVMRGGMRAWRRASRPMNKIRH